MQGSVKMGAEIGAGMLQAKEQRGPPETGSKEGPSSRAFGENMIQPNLDFRLLASRAVREYLLFHTQP